jgi:hypothetical protein
MNNSMGDLVGIFRSAEDILAQEREALNLADTINTNHGDHMLEIFRVAARAIQALPLSDLPGSLEEAGHLLAQLEANASARVYAHGLEQFGRAFRQHQVEFDDLAGYVQHVLQEPPSGGPQAEQSVSSSKSEKGGEVLKALVAGLAAWVQVENGENPSEKGVDVGYLFELGMVYMQAKSRGGSRLDVLAEAAVNASPLSRVPYRAQSGKLVFSALLQAFSVIP